MILKYSKVCAGLITLRLVVLMLFVIMMFMVAYGPADSAPTLLPRSSGCDPSPDGPGHLPAVPRLRDVDGRRVGCGFAGTAPSNVSRYSLADLFYNPFSRELIRKLSPNLTRTRNQLFYLRKAFESTREVARNHSDATQGRYNW